MSKMGNPNLFADAIAEALEFEWDPTHGDSHGTNAAIRTVFLEGDDCKLLLATKAAFQSLVASHSRLASVAVTHFPCEPHPPTLYRASNVTGHNQIAFNAGHTCADTVRYFAALTVFRDAGAVLLGPGGNEGVALHHVTSNTVLLIEQLRGGRAKREPRGRDYHTGRGNAVIFSFPEARPLPSPP
jgi:hypothetical protein